MIKYFQKQLDSIFSAKQALAKEKYKSRYSDILTAHPALAQDIKKKKSLELELSKYQALNKPFEDTQNQLDALTLQIENYLTQNNLSLDMQYECEKCQDTGYVDSKPCECRLNEYKKLIKANISLTALPKFCFEDNTFAKSNVPQAKGMTKLYKIMSEVCDKFYTTKLQNFLFSGASGVGKTSLVVACANKLTDMNISVLYLSSFELINIFLDKHTNKPTALRKWYDYLLDCECLIIDNLGTEPIYKNVTIEYLLSTIEKRLTAGKKTMICTQLDAVMLANRYGESFLSKFADKKYSLSVGYINGEDMRK